MAVVMYWIDYLVNVNCLRCLIFVCESKIIELRDNTIHCYSMQEVLVGEEDEDSSA